MATRTLSGFDVRALWPSKWGASGTLVITLDKSVVSEDGVEYPATTNAGGALRSLGFHWQSIITVASNLATCGSVTGLINTDVAIPGHTARYNVYVYDSKGRMREKLNSKPFHIHESLNGGATAFTWEQWVNAMEFTQFRGPTTFVGDMATVQGLMSAQTHVKASEVLIGESRLSDAPASAIDPVALAANSRRVGSAYNVTATAIGATGDGTTNDRAALNTLLNTTLQITGAGGRAHLPAGDYLIGSNMTIPANVVLDLDPHARFKLANGVTITDLTDHSDWDGAQKFTNALSGQGTVSFVGNTSPGKVKPTWWGTLSTAGVISAAIAALPTGGGQVEIGNGNQTLAAFVVSKPTFMDLGHGDYTMAGAISVIKNFFVDGQGGLCTKLIGASGQKLFNLSGIFDPSNSLGAFVKFSKVTLDGASRTATNAIYVPDSTGGNNFLGQLIIEQCTIQNFGASSSYAVDLGNSVFFNVFRDTVFLGNEGGVRTGNDSNIEYDNVQFGGIRSLPHITTNGFATIDKSSFVYGETGTGTTTPDIWITSDGTDPGYVRIGSKCKFGPEGEVSTRFKILISSPSSPTTVFPGITIGGGNQFSGVLGQTMIGLQSPVLGLRIDEDNDISGFSNVINDIQPYVNAAQGLSTFAAHPSLAPGGTIFTNGGKGFAARQVPGIWMDERFIKSEYLTGLINRVPNSGALNSWTSNGASVTTGQTDPLGGTTAFLLTRANASSQESIFSAVLDFTTIVDTEPAPTTSKQIILDIAAQSDSVGYMSVALYDFTDSLTVLTKRIALKSIWDTYRIPVLGLDQTHQYKVYLYPGDPTVTAAGTVKVWRVNASDYGTDYLATDGSGSAATSTQGARFYAPVGFAAQIASTLATGTAPFAVASTTKVTNLNADKLDGQDFADPGPLGGGTPSTGAFTALSASGNASVGGVLVRAQLAPSTPTTATTLTIANLLIGIVTATPTATGATVVYTLPTGTNMSGGGTFANNDSFDWSITNLAAAAADTITITANTDHTIVGNPIVQSSHATTGGITGNSAVFRSRKVSATVWVTYRIS